jgi:hypothetical protein
MPGLSRSRKLAEQYRRESKGYRAKLNEDLEMEPEVRKSLPQPVDLPRIMNQQDANEQTFENMAKYLAKTVDIEVSPKHDLSMVMNSHQSPAFFDPNSGFRKTPERRRDEEKTQHDSGATALAV